MLTVTEVRGKRKRRWKRKKMKSGRIWLHKKQQWYNLCVCVPCVCALVPYSLKSHGLQPTRLLWPWDFPGKNSGVGGQFLLQGMFLTKGSNPSLLHWQALSHLRSPDIISALCFSQGWTFAVPVCTWEMDFNIRQGFLGMRRVWQGTEGETGRTGLAGFSSSQVCVFKEGLI